MMYNKLVETCFFSPHHVGEIDTTKDFTVHSRTHKNNQGILIDFSLRCSHEGLIQCARFKAVGNPFVIASLEWLCRQIEGKLITNLPELTYKTLVQQLNIPTFYYPVAIQVEEVYKEALRLMIKSLG